jgi:hypothetical protein
MQFINTTFAHGNGPYSRTTDLALAINAELKTRGEEPFHVVVPLVYGKRQKKIMQESLGEVLTANPDLILLDELQGDILNKLFFKTGNYEQNLEHLLENQPRLESQLRDYLSGTLRLKTFDGKSRNVNSRDIAFEISHNPRVATGFQNSFYTTIGLFSEILEQTYQETLEGRIKGFNPAIVKEAVAIAKRIEDDRKVHFIPEPFVFSYDKTRKRREKEIFTPPFIHVPKPNNEQVIEGMYVMLTGIDGLSSLFEEVNKFGMKLYCPPFVKVKGADNNHAPNFVANHNIKYQFARTGWSSVWLSHMTETPLITPAYTTGDDTEIYFNEKSVGELVIASTFNPLNITKTLRQADSQIPKMRAVNRALIRNYKTLDGIDYTAKAIVDSLQGKSLDNYREITPALNHLSIQ